MSERLDSLLDDTTHLDVIAARFAALERAWYGHASTRTVNAGVASLRAAIDAGQAQRTAYLAGPWTATPIDPIAQVTPLRSPPDSVTERTVPVVSVTAADAIVPPQLTCPLCCLATDRAHVEQYGRCYDCALLAPAPTSPASTDASPTSEAIPPGGPVSAAGVGGAGGSAVRAPGANNAGAGVGGSRMGASESSEAT
jgi:hypothetical protein